MEPKKRYKLYKSGKLWCCAAIAFAAFALGTTTLTSTSYADTNASASQAAGTTTPAQTATSTTSTPTTTPSNQMPATTPSTVNTENTNAGHLDQYSLSTNQQGQATLNVQGWQATGHSTSQQYRYVLVYDNTAKREVTRQAVTPQRRDDVQRAYSNVAGSDYAGFNANILLPNLSALSGHSLSFVSRYSSDPQHGEGQYTDFWFNPVIVDNDNQAFLDDISSDQDGNVTVSGWHVSNQAANKPYHYIIAYDRTIKQEITRKQVTANQERPDVAKAFPMIANAGIAGFNVSFKLTPQYAKDDIVFVSRWTTDPAGNGNATDFWFNGLTKVNRANLDLWDLQNGGLHVTGWHADDASVYAPYHSLIVYDKTSNRQVGAQLIQNIASPDVQKVYGNDTRTAGKARFDVDLGKLPLEMGHTYAIVSRYSDVKDGNGGSGDSVDYWLPDFTLNQAGSNFDTVEVTGDRLLVKGWFASDAAVNKDSRWVILLVNGKEVARQKIQATARPDVAKVYPQMYDSANSGFEASFDLPNTTTDHSKGDYQVVFRYSDDAAKGEGNHIDAWSAKQDSTALYANRLVISQGKFYYLDANGQLVRNQTVNVDRIQMTFDKDGVATADLDTLRTLTGDRAVELLQANKQFVKADWQSSDDNYAAFSVHQMAQLIAQGDIKNDSAIIEKVLDRSSLLNGTVVASYTTDLKQTNFDGALANFTAELATKQVNGDYLGVGLDPHTMKLALLLVDSKKASQPVETSTSTLAPTVQELFKHAGVNVDVENGLQKGQTLGTDDLGNLTANLNLVLKGPKGQAISEDVLKTIFAGLPGNENALEGIKTYKHGNDSYHYVYWLEGQSANDKMNNFLNANKGAKYGDALKINYSAILTWGAPVKPAANDDKTPETEKTADEVKLAYKTGSETGARYETVKVDPIPNMTLDTVRGVDVSAYLALINNGVQFYDFNGQPTDLMKVLADAGVNYVRIRLWVNPYNADGLSYGGGNDDEQTAIEIAKNAKKYGIKTYLDLQFSDFWADPATQALPKAWKNLSDENINTELYLYNKKLINDFNKAGIQIGMVQLGNEITKGMMEVSEHGSINVWKDAPYATRLTNLLNSASRAYREDSKDTKIALHVESPNINDDQLIMTSLDSHNVSYDIFATSYYPFWGWGDSSNTWGNNPTVIAKIEQLAKDHGKQYMVAECSWPFTLQNADGTSNNISSDPGHYAVSAQGQVDAMSEMYKTILSNSNGLGAFYWEPDWIPVRAGWDNWQFNKYMGETQGTGWASMNSRGYYPDSKLIYNGQPASGGSSWDNMTLFDDNGHPLQSLMMYKGFLDGYTSPAVVKKQSPVTIRINKIWNDTDVTPADGLTVNGTVAADQFLDSQATALLTGDPQSAISDENLAALAGSLKDGVKSVEYTAANGAQYHYEFWLNDNTEAVKTDNFIAANQGVKYGQNLTATYSARVVVDAEPNAK